MRHSDINERARGPGQPEIRRIAMRLVDVVLASVLLGMGLAYLNMGHDAGKAAAGSNAQVTASARVTWMRTPAMLAPTQVR
jgi:hypothetical protein